MRLVMNYRRPARWWLSSLCAGVCVATAFAVLAISDAAPAFVQITGGSAQAGPASPYDIIVSPPGTGAASGCRCLTSPADLTSFSGGITMAQYDKISGLPGVEVAAPMTMVGYVPLTVNMPIDVPASLIPGAPRLVTLTVRLLSDNGLSSATWDDVTMTRPAGRDGPRPATVSVGVSWTFELPLVAVDPVAEARLLHLDAALTSGSYLSEAAATPSGTVPVLMAGSIADGEEANVTFNLPSSAPASTVTLTASGAYSQLVGEAREKPGTVRTYWTATPVTYGIAADGELMPQPIAVNTTAVWSGPYEWAGTPPDGGVLDTAFRSLTPHTALGAGVAVRAVGVFNPNEVTSTPVAPNPYKPQAVTGADARSRQLLGGRPLGADDDPGGFPDAAASLVMPLADIGAFTLGYRGTNTAAPIGVIRVRVAGVTGNDTASQERVRQVAQEIVRATGLHVDAVLAQTASTKVVDLPAGSHGRPQLRVDEVWFATDTRTTVQAGVDRHSMSLSELDLVAGEVVLAWGLWRLVGARRRELATLRALGWRRRQVGAHLLAEFALTALVAGIAAVVAAYVVGTALIGRPTWAWLLLSLPAATTVILAVACWPLLRTAALVLAGPVPADSLPWRLAARAWGRVRRGGALPPRPMRTLFRAPSRTLLGMFIVALACMALSLELSTRWVFGSDTESWAGRSASWQGTTIDFAVVLVIMTMATFMLADLDGVTFGERSAEVRTLRAIGWSVGDVARLTVWNAVRLGVAGGLAAGVFDLLGGLAVTGSVPPRLIAVAGLVVVAGVAMSLLAVAQSARLVTRSSKNC
jgi:putative ABC transport system permease protein